MTVFPTFLNIRISPLLNFFFNPHVLTGSLNQENILYWSQQQIQVFERWLPNSNEENRGSQVLAVGAALAAKLCEFTEPVD
jgi:hypothetical protein